MDTEKQTFDFHDAIVLYAAIVAGDKGISSQGIVLLRDHVDYAKDPAQDIDKSLELLQETGQLKRRGQTYYASRTAVEECGPKTSELHLRAAIDEVLKYLLAQGPLTADAWRRTRPIHARGARPLWRGPKPGSR